MADSEDKITTSKGWKSKRAGTWVDPDLEDDATTSHDPWTRGDPDESVEDVNTEDEARLIPESASNPGA